MTHLLRALAALALFASGACAHAESFSGIVTHVTDGDTLWVRPVSGGAPRQVRLQGIDAPEICQTWGPQARRALAVRVLHRHVGVASRGRDAYERTLGQVESDRQDLGSWLVSRGHAWSDRFRGRSGRYAKEESAARAARLGLWSGGSALPPREFRSRHGSCRNAGAPTRPSRPWLP
jgi:micrococcal nuclease